MDKWRIVVKKFALYLLIWTKHLTLHILYIRTLLSPNLLRWIHECLSSRSQAVVLGGNTSNILPFVSGVPPRISVGPIAVFDIHEPSCKLRVLYQCSLQCMLTTLLCIISFPTQWLHLPSGRYPVTWFLDCQQLPNSESPEVLLHDFYQKTPISNLYTNNRSQPLPDLSWSHHIDLICTNHQEISRYVRP